MAEPVQPTTPSSDLDERMRRFIDTATQFSREFTAVAGPVLGRRTSRLPVTNVDLSRSLFSKWIIEILLLLYASGELGFQDIQRALRTISPRVLSQKLRLLEERDLVRRTVLTTRPTRVHYSLTADGLDLAKLREPVFIFLRYRRRRRSQGTRTTTPGPRSPGSPPNPPGPLGRV